ARLRRRNSPRADRTRPRQACEKFPGTTNTVLCYRQTFRSLFCCRKHCLVNMFVTEEAFVVSQIQELSGLGIDLSIYDWSTPGRQKKASECNTLDYSSHVFDRSW